MLGFGSISEVAISEIPEIGGIQQAIWSAVGAGSFAGIGASSATAVLAAVGAGSLSGSTQAIRSSVLSSAGVGQLSGTTAARVAAVFAAAGAGNFTAVPVIFTAPRVRGNQITTIDMIVDMGDGGRVPQVNRTSWSERPSPSRDKRGRKINWDA